MSEHDSPLCHECGADVDTDAHHVWCIAPLDQIDDQLADEGERAAVAAMPGPRPHYELNDGTCVSCGEAWMCAGYIESLAGDA